MQSTARLPQKNGQLAPNLDQVFSTPTGLCEWILFLFFPYLNKYVKDQIKDLVPSQKTRPRGLQLCETSRISHQLLEEVI